MIPVITTAYNQAIDASDDYHRQAEYLKETFWNTLVEEDFLREVESSPVGLLLHPLDKPHRLVFFFDRYCGVKFTRQRDESGLYQWVTAINEFNIQLWIVANENIDLTGTEITFNPLAQ